MAATSYVPVLTASGLRKTALDDLPAGSTTDAAAIHTNQAGEIAALTAKATPVSADLLIIEDSEASNVKKKVQVGSLGGGTTTNLMRVNLAGSPTTEGVARTGSTASNYVRANAQVRILRPILLTELIIDLAAAGDYYVKWYYGEDGAAIDSTLTGALMFTLGPVTVGGSTNDQSMPLATPLFVPPGNYVFSLERASGTSIMPAATSGTFVFSYHDNDGIPTSATRIPFRMVAYPGDYELVTA